jgi:pyridinium-3,5-bisthiocarboxylic acid mononucleotide nickel chelatase
MKIAWLDCSAGVSGDMLLGALVDAGVSLSAIKKKLSLISIEGYTISSKPVTRNSVAATKVDVRLSKSSTEARRWKDVRKLINSSALDKSIKEKGLAIFEMLFEAEAAVHKASIDTVHLHELGAVDCMVDIFGTIIGLELLEIDKLTASAVNTGEGTVNTAHGVMPVPAPATIKLLQGIPCYSSGISFELTTPTGAALLRGLVGSFGRMPAMCVDKVGYGAGTREIADMPNALRILAGSDYCNTETDSKIAGDNVLVIETNIDDMNPQYYESVMSRLFAAGALDVFLENIIMKKGRPAIKLTAIIKSNDVANIARILFSETTTIGLRMHTAGRITLDRTAIRIKTKFGIVHFKISGHDGKTITVTPEYDDLKAISEKTGIPVKTIAARLSRISIPKA